MSWVLNFALFFSPSFFWCAVATASRNEDLDKVRFTTIVKPDQWKTVMVNDSSLQQHVFNWYNLVKESKTTKMSTSYVVRDECLGIRCNPTCPDDIQVVYDISEPWSVPASSIIIILCTSFLAICCILKVR